MADNIKIEVPNITSNTGDTLISVKSWSWNLKRNGDPKAYKLKDAVGGTPDVGEVTVVKTMDAASSVLLKYCCDGDILDQVTLTVFPPESSPVKVLKLVMDRCIVASIDFGPQDENENTVEVIQFRFSGFSFDYNPADGTPEYSYGYDGVECRSK